MTIIYHADSIDKVQTHNLSVGHLDENDPTYPLKQRTIDCLRELSGLSDSPHEIKFLIIVGTY